MSDDARRTEALLQPGCFEITLTLGALHGLPLRQTEGFIRALIELMRLDLAVPDHATLAPVRADHLAGPFGFN